MVNLDVWSIILGFGALNGFFLAAVLWFSKKGFVKSNRLLAALLFSISIFTFELIISRMGYYLGNPSYSLFSFPFAYFVAPLFYLYARSFITSEGVLQKTDLKHLVFPILALSALIPYYFWEPENKLTYIQQFNDPSGLSFRHFWLGGIFLLQTALYFGLTYRFLKVYQKQYKKESSHTGIQQFEWLNKLMLTFLIFILCNAAISALYLGAQFIDLSRIEKMIFPAVEINMIILTFFAHIVGYNAINHPTQLFPMVTRQARYSRSTLSEEQSMQYLRKAQEYMTDKKLYLNPDLSLGKLAEILEVSPDHLSQVINKELSVNFYDFVNQFRVREAQQRLADPRFSSYTILGIALDSGFNSKSSFNRIFKKHLGITPSEFLSHHQSS